MVEELRFVAKTLARSVPLSVLLLAFAQGATGQNHESGREIARSQSVLPLPSLPDVRTRHSEHSELLGRVDEALDEIERMIEDAYFRTALGMVETGRGRLDELGLLSALNPRRARLEVLAATAEVALDLRIKAMGSMRRALRADPGLTLDERRTPPKVYALLREARTGRTFRSTR